MILGESITQFLTLERPLVWLDVETHAKLPPEHGRIIELGFEMLYPDGREPKRWVSYINPGVPITADATGVHRIKDEDVSSAPRFNQVAASLAKGFSHCDFGGYNVRFDLRCIEAEMTRAGVPWSYRDALLLDSLRLWQLGASRTLSDAVREFCGREPREAHRALGDAQDAQDAAVGMLRRFEKLPRELKALHELSFKNPDHLDADGKIIWVGEEAALNFGKHSGMLLKNVGRGYLEWICGTNFPADVKKIATDALNGVYPKKS